MYNRTTPHGKGRSDYKVVKNDQKYSANSTVYGNRSLLAHLPTKSRISNLIPSSAATMDLELFTCRPPSAGPFAHRLLEGFPCDNAVSHETVLANPSILGAVAESCSDLSLALEGGLNKFGVTANFV